MKPSRSTGGPETTSPLSPAILALGGALVAASELIPFALEQDDIPLEALGLGNYLVPLFAIPIIAATLHGLLALTGLRLVGRFAAKMEALYWLVLAAVFGGLWQDTVMHGDGVRSFAYYDALRVAGWILGPAVTAAGVWFLAFEKRIPLLIRRVLASAALVAAGVGLHLVLPSYKDFHGYLALFAATMAVWLVAPWLRNRAASTASWSLLIASFLSVVALPGWMSGQRYAQRFSQVPSAFLHLDTTAWMQLPPESALDPDTSFTSSQLAEIRRQFSAVGGELSGKPQGKNVLFIVLESTRADAWADPEIAPEFQKWRKHGLYFPRAIAQYPATPLAYGAMFTSQPPSILTQTPRWAESRLFDRIAPRFDHLILSKPKNPWFEHSAITDFFVPRATDVSIHPSVSTGLRNIRRGLREVPEDESFFAWVHIYEPHQPWVTRKKYTKAKGNRAAYLSEVSLVDDTLGDFMRWFYKQPFSEETLVVIFSDHGEGLGERIDGKAFRGHHVHVRNVVSHIPAYFSGPGIPAGEIAEGYTVQQLDVMPTIFDFLGEELPRDTFPQGDSLYRLMKEEPQRPYITEAFSIRGKDFFEFVANVDEADTEEVRKRFTEVTRSGKYSPKVALQYGNHKLIRDMLLGRSWVYDIEADPEEKKDLSADAPQIVESLTQRLDDWKTRQSWIIRQLEAPD